MTKQHIQDVKKGQPLSLDSFRTRVKMRSDRLMNYFLGIYFTGGFIAASFYNTWITAIISGSALLLIYFAFKKLVIDSNIYQYVLSVIMGLFMVQYIYQMHGTFELYFFAFVGSTILITYQNWRLQIPLFAIVFIHLAIFGYHQQTSFSNPYIGQLNTYELQRFILHIVFSALIFFICGLWAYLLKKYSEVQVTQTKEMERLQKEALLAVKEQAVIDSNNRFSYAAQATSDAIWDRNYSSDEVFWGDGYKVLFGYEINPQTTTAGFWASKVHPDDLDNIKKITQRAKDDPSVNSWSCEYRFLKADGEYAFVKEKAIILRDKNGVPERTIGALQDITELKKRELILEELNDKLEQEKYYLDSLMDNMPDAIYFKDKESRFIRVSAYMVNKHLANHPGATINDLIGKTDFDLQDEKHAREAYEDEQEIQKTRKPKIDYIEKEIAEDGSERWVATTKLPMLNAQGEIVGTFGISRDVTKIKMLEKQQHEAMLDKAVAQGRFEIASEVMHDIGNAISGFGSHLSRIKRMQENASIKNLGSLITYFEEQKATIANAIGDSKASAVINILESIVHTQHENEQETIKSVTEQLNIISNIEEILNIQRKYISGYESKDRKTVNLKDIIDDSLSMLLSFINKNNIDVSLNIANDLPAIKGDRTKLMQLMLNLLKNSIEATEGNKHTKNISINAYMEDGRLMLEVKDNGQGFDNGLTDKLFQRGFSTKANGRGVGLYNCRAIVESHEGIIDIASEGQGKGTTTTIGFKNLAA
jgi:PAS domain S-box-containing protein